MSEEIMRGGTAQAGDVQIPKRLNLLFIPRDNKGCGFYRMLVPANEIKRQDLANVTVNFGWDWKMVEWAHIIIVQRMTDIQAYEAFDQAHSLGKKIIFEMDDYVNAISPNNPSFDFWSPFGPNYARCLKIMQKSDAVQVTTDRLKKEYALWNPHIETLGNYPDKHLWDIPAWTATHWDNYYKKKNDGIIRIGWAGAASHYEDLQLVEDVLTKICQKYKNVHLCLLGYHGEAKKGPNLFQDIPLATSICSYCKHNGQLEKSSGIKLLYYPSKLKECAFDIGIAPLIETGFNQCKCVVADTLINSESGLEEIKPCVENNALTPITKKIFDGKNLQEVTYYHKYLKQKTIKITTFNGYSIEGTETHRIKDNEGSWISLQKAVSNLEDYNIKTKLKLTPFKFFNKLQAVFLPWNKTKTWKSQKRYTSKKYNLPVATELQPNIIITPEYAEIIGALVGDGHFSSGNINIACDDQDKDTIKYFESLVGKLGLHPSISKEKNANCYYVSWSSSLFMNLLDKLEMMDETGKKNLIVPKVILQSPKHVVAAFIKGLFEADAHVKDVGIQFVTKSEKLAKQIHVLLLGFGIICRKSITKNNQFGKTRYYYRIDLGRHASEVYQQEIGFISKRKKDRLEKQLSKKHSNAYKEMSFADEVYEIDFNTKNVYDITVDKTSQYFGNGFINHNSDIKIKEYAAIGVPVIATRMKPYSESVKEGYTGFLATTGKEWFDSLELLIKDKGLREKLGRNNYRWYKENTIDKHIHKWITFYNRVISFKFKW